MTARPDDGVSGYVGANARGTCAWDRQFSKNFHSGIVRLLGPTAIPVITNGKMGGQIQRNGIRPAGKLCDIRKFARTAADETS